MEQRFERIWRIYKEGTRMDWLVVGADVLGIAIVAAAFINARAGDDTVNSAITIASAAGF